MRINRDKATPCRFEIGERRLIISPPFQPFETEVHKKKKSWKTREKPMSEPIYFSIVDRNSWKTCVGGVWNDTFQQENGFHRWERIERGEGEGKKGAGV